MSVSRNRKTMIDNFTGDPNYQISEYRRSVHNMLYYLDLNTKIVLDGETSDENLIAQSVKILERAYEEMIYVNKNLHDCFMRLNFCLREAAHKKQQMAVGTNVKNISHRR